MILLCNDDGFNANGLRTLYRELSQDNDVIIVAPETEQSAMGHAITLTQPLKVRKVEEEGKLIGYAVNGTPADCVKLAIAVLLEATLSFLGVGVPPTEPSLGTLIRIGQDFLFSGEWWIVIFPGVFLALLVLSVNLLGDWLRDALNPKLR